MARASSQFASGDDRHDLFQGLLGAFGQASVVEHTQGMVDDGEAIVGQAPHSSNGLSALAKLVGTDRYGRRAGEFGFHGVVQTARAA